MKKDLQLYIHIPFCIHKCRYCTACVVTGDSAAKKEYLTALERELDAAVPTLQDYRIADIEVGGGSPSVMNPDDLAMVIRHLREKVDVAPYAETCIQMIPQTVCTPSLTGLGRARFNRISLSMQSAIDSELETLDCGFTFEQVKNAMLFLDKFHCNNVNLDVMYGIPGQTAETWMDTLRAVRDFGVVHISLYPFSEAADKTVLKEDSLATNVQLEEQLLTQACDFLRDLDYERYSRYHFAVNDHTSKYVLNRANGMEYMGFGLGARSLIDGMTYANTDDYAAYVADSGDFTRIVRDVVELSPEQLEEYKAAGEALLDVEA